MHLCNFCKIDFFDIGSWCHFVLFLNCTITMMSFVNFQVCASMLCIIDEWDVIVERNFERNLCY